MQLLNLTPLDALFDPHGPALTSTPSTSRFATAKRSHLAGELRPSHVGAKVRLGGWVHRTRNLGGIVFLDLRDRAGLVQVSFDPKWTPVDVIERAGKLGLETVVTIEGDLNGPGPACGYGPFTGAIPYPDTVFAPFTATATASSPTYFTTGPNSVVPVCR